LSVGLDRDGFLAWLGAGLLRQRERQHALAETGVDLLAVDSFRQGEAALEAAERAFGEVITLLLFFTLLAFFTL